MALTLNQNTGIWPWSPSITSVTYKPVDGAVGSSNQRYQLWDAIADQAMITTQGGSDPDDTAYDLERSPTDQWWDMAGDSPKYFIWSSSTTAPSSTNFPPTGSTTGATGSSGVSIGSATTTAYYLHIFTGFAQLDGSATYMGYIDAWSSFHSGGPGPSSTPGSSSSKKGSHNFW